MPMSDARDKDYTSFFLSNNKDEGESPRATSGSSLANGDQTSGNHIPENGKSAAQMNGRPHHEESLLVKDIKNVSIDRSGPGQDDIDAYLRDVEDEETEPPQPFMADVATGYCYDVRMRYHSELKPPENRRDFHPEDPRRIFSIYRELCVAGLIYDDLLTKTSLTARPLRRVDAREVDEGEVCLVHTKKHWEMMRATKGIVVTRVACRLGGLIMCQIYQRRS